MGACSALPDRGTPLQLKLSIFQVHYMGTSHTGVTDNVQRVDWRMLECRGIAVAFMESRNGEHHFQLSNANRNLVGIWVLLTHFDSNQCHLGRFIHANMTIMVDVGHSAVMASYRGRTSS